MAITLITIYAAIVDTIYYLLRGKEKSVLRRHELFFFWRVVISVSLEQIFPYVIFSHCFKYLNCVDIDAELVMIGVDKFLFWACTFRNLAVTDSEAFVDKALHLTLTVDSKEFVKFEWLRTVLTNYPTMQNIENFVKGLKCISFVVNLKLFLLVVKFGKLHSYRLVLNYWNLTASVA